MASHQVASLIGLALAPYLPGSNETAKNMIALTLSNLAMSTVSLIPTIRPLVNKLYYRFVKTSSILIKKDEENPIYGKLEVYILNKYLTELKRCQLQKKVGKIEYTLEHSIFSKTLYDEFNGKKVYLEVFIDKLKIANELEIDIPCIIVSSKEMDVKGLKLYIDHICLFKTDSKIAKTYRAVVDEIHSEKTKTKQSARATWKEYTIKTNRRIVNTILSNENEQALYHDISKFMNSEHLYNEKGWPWKRGYLLHGPPGTGKTSAIKAIANEYPEIQGIFMMNLHTIASCTNGNSIFESLMSDINILTNNKPYILAFEDVDRVNMWPKVNYRGDLYFDSDGTQGLSINCFLNELDGIVECHGRILFMTGNDLKPFEPIKNVLFRPGRVDKQIKIDHCQLNQAKKIISHFYNEDEQVLNQLETFTEIRNEISAATIVNLLQTTEDFETICQITFNGIKLSDESKMLINEIENVKTISTTLKAHVKNPRSQNFTGTLKMAKKNINRAQKILDKPEELITKQKKIVERETKRIESIKKRQAAAKAREKRTREQEKKRKEKLKKQKLTSNKEKPTRKRKLTSNKEKPTRKRKATTTINKKIKLTSD